MTRTQMPAPPRLPEIHISLSPLLISKIGIKVLLYPTIITRIITLKTEKKIGILEVSLNKSI